MHLYWCFNFTKKKKEKKEIIILIQLLVNYIFMLFRYSIKIVKYNADV